MSFQFWRRWLMVVTVGVIVYAFGLILLPDVVQQFFNLMVFSASDTSQQFPDNANHYIRFAHGVLGAVIIGWMLTFLSVLATGFQRGQRSAWNTLALSVLAWYLIDTGFSLYVGIVAHAVFNTVFLMLFAIPLAATYRSLEANTTQISP